MGQEPYSIAMCVREWLETQDHFQAADTVIHAVDISNRIIQRARKAEYSDKELGTSLPGEYKMKYFVRNADKWNVAKGIRSMVRFTVLNMSEPFEHIGKLDIIFCRNVIIYFPLELKTKILQNFHSMLNSGGALIMGSSENLYNLSKSFESAQYGKTMYYTPR